MAPPPGGWKNPGKRIATAVLTPDRGVSFFVPVLIKNINQQFLDFFFFAVLQSTRDRRGIGRVSNGQTLSIFQTRSLMKWMDRRPDPFGLR